MFCQLVDKVCYLQTLAIVFVAVKTFSGVFVPQGIATVFLCVEPFVFYLPSVSGRFGQLADVVCRYLLIGEPYKPGRWLLLWQWHVVAAIAGDCFCAAEPPVRLPAVVKWRVYPLVTAFDVRFAFRFGKSICLLFGARQASLNFWLVSFTFLSLFGSGSGAGYNALHKALTLYATLNHQNSVHLDRKSTRLNSSHERLSRMPSSA